MGSWRETLASGEAAALSDQRPQSVAFAKTTCPAIASAVPRERLFARLRISGEMVCVGGADPRRKGAAAGD